MHWPFSLNKLAYVQSIKTNKQTKSKQQQQNKTKQKATRPGVGVGGGGSERAVFNSCIFFVNSVTENGSNNLMK